jgi:predicted nucleic-acid-binding Zn-ribbon protein
MAVRGTDSDPYRNATCKACGQTMSVLDPAEEDRTFLLLQARRDSGGNWHAIDTPFFKVRIKGCLECGYVELWARDDIPAPLPGQHQRPI